MECYRLHIDGATYYVRRSRESIRADMHAYVRAQLALGRPLRSIEYAYTPVRYQVYAAKATDG